MFKFILLLIIFATAATSLNTFRPLRGSPQGTREYSRVMRGLLERQGCGWQIPISEAVGSGCCQPGDAYCSYDNISFDGKLTLIYLCVMRVDESSRLL